MASGVDESEKLASLRVLESQVSNTDLFTDEERSAVDEEIKRQRDQVAQTFEKQYADALKRLEVVENRMVKRREVLTKSDAIGANPELCKLFAAEQAKIQQSMLDLVAECEDLERRRKGACA